MTLTAERSSPTSVPERPRRGLMALVIALALALVALSGWVLFDALGSESTEVPAEIEELLDDYIAARVSSDPDAFAALVTDDFTYRETGYAGAGAALLGFDMPASLDEILGQIEFSSDDWQVELTGTRIISGDGPWFVSQVENWTESMRERELIGVATYVVVDDSGTYKVFSKTWLGRRIG